MTFRNGRRWPHAPLEARPALKETLWMFVVVLDYGCNVLFLRGWANETISARCWRLRHKNRRWARARRFVDWVFARFGDYNHCQTSYQNELDRAYSPPEMRADAKLSAGDKI